MVLCWRLAWAVLAKDFLAASHHTLLGGRNHYCSISLRLRDITRKWQNSPKLEPFQAPCPLPLQDLRPTSCRPFSMTHEGLHPLGPLHTLFLLSRSPFLLCSPEAYFYKILCSAALVLGVSPQGGSCPLAQLLFPWFPYVGHSGCLCQHQQPSLHAF